MVAERLTFVHDGAMLTLSAPFLSSPATHPALAPIFCPSGEVLWESGAVTSYGHRVYTRGDCWALAYAMSELMVAPGPSTYRLYTLGTTARWYHVVMRVAEDLYLDADGLSSGQELEERWGRLLYGVEPEDHPSWAAFRRLLREGWNFEPREDEAYATARALLLTHAPHLLKARPRVFQRLSLLHS